MELAYRLAVDESAYIKNIRENVITLITPIVEISMGATAWSVFIAGIWPIRESSGRT